jgi:hypothetical protein
MLEVQEQETHGHARLSCKQIPWLLKYETGTAKKQHADADDSHVSLSNYENMYDQAYKKKEGYINQVIYASLL